MTALAAWLILSSTIMFAWGSYQLFIYEPRAKKRRAELHELVNQHKAELMELKHKGTTPRFF